MKILKNKAFIFTTVLSILLYVIFVYLFQSSIISTERIQEFVNQFGFSGYLTLFFTQLLASLTPLPDTVLPVISIVLYGPIGGSLIIYFAMFVASIANYFFAHRMGHNYVKKHIPEAQPFLEKVHSGNVFFKLTLIRIFSVLTIDLASYIAGVSGIKFRTFFFSTMVGLLPFIINNILIAQGLSAKSWEELATIVVLYAIFILVTWLASKFFKRVEDLPL